MGDTEERTEDRPCETCGTSLEICLHERKVTFERCCGPCKMRDTHSPASPDSSSEPGAGVEEGDQ